MEEKDDIDIICSKNKKFSKEYRIKCIVSVMVFYDGLFNWINFWIKV